MDGRQDKGCCQNREKVWSTRWQHGRLGRRLLAGPPATGWEFIKEAADVSVDLALKHGYKFICTSNFTHPQFTGMGDDVAWHKSITGRIRRGS